jgi:hypothetical protein
MGTDIKTLWSSNYGLTAHKNSPEERKGYNKNSWNSICINLAPCQQEWIIPNVRAT